MFFRSGYNARIDLKSEVVDFWVSVDVIHDSLQLVSRGGLDVVSGEMLDEFYFIIAIGDFGFLSAYSFVFIASDFNTCLAIGAEEGQASWHNNNWISIDNISLGFS